MSRYLQIILAVVLTGFILWFAKPFLVPFAYALMIAMVIYPACRFLERRGWGRGLSIGVPILLVCLVFGSLLTLLSYELTVLAGNWHLIQDKLDVVAQQVQVRIEQDFGWTADEQRVWLEDYLNKMSSQAGGYISSTISAIMSALVDLFIIPIYVALLLAYRTRLVDFVVTVSPARYRHKMPEVMSDTVNVFGRFIRGMVLVYAIVGLLNAFGLWLIGVEGAFTFGMITAVMTIIPYFGIIISAMLPITMTWLETGMLWQSVGIVAVFAVVQYLEANLIFPYVVGRFVNLNTLASILAIFVGALLWGVSGMILFIPLLAVARVFMSHFPELKPWERLIGQ